MFCFYEILGQFLKAHSVILTLAVWAVYRFIRGYSTDESIVNTSLDTLKLTLIDTVKPSAFDGSSGVRTKDGYYELAENIGVYISRSRTGLFRCRRRIQLHELPAYTPIKQRKTAEKSV